VGHGGEIADDRPEAFPHGKMVQMFWHQPGMQIQCPTTVADVASGKYCNKYDFLDWDLRTPAPNYWFYEQNYATGTITGDPTDCMDLCDVTDACAGLYWYPNWQQTTTTGGRRRTDERICYFLYPWAGAGDAWFAKNGRKNKPWHQHYRLYHFFITQGPGGNDQTDIYVKSDYDRGYRSKEDVQPDTICPSGFFGYDQKAFSR